MSYKLNYLDDKNIVTVEIEGRVNFNIVQEYSTAALKLAREHNCSRFFLDHTGILPGTDTSRLHTDGDTLEQFGFKSNDKIAVLINGDPSKEQFLQTAKANVKWSNTRYFSKAAEALKWLEEE